MSKPQYRSATIGIIPPGPRPQQPLSTTKKKRRWWPGMMDQDPQPTFTADELARQYPRSMLDKDETSIQNRRTNRRIEAVPPSNRKRLPHHGRPMPTGYENMDDNTRSQERKPR